MNNSLSFSSFMFTAMMALALSACSSDSSEKVVALQKKDKALSCRDVLLEQNEAEFYRKTAEKNKELHVKNLIMPIGYISTYMSAEDAIDAANSRTEYLGRIYEIMDCDSKLSQSRVANRQALDIMKENGDQPAVAYAPQAPQPQVNYAPVRYVMPAAPVQQVQTIQSAPQIQQVPMQQVSAPQGYMQPQFYNAQAQTSMYGPPSYY